MIYFPAAAKCLFCVKPSESNQKMKRVTSSAETNVSSFLEVAHPLKSRLITISPEQETCFLHINPIELGRNLSLLLFPPWK